MYESTSLLYLASGSATRKQLLTDARIPFNIVAQDADESLCSRDQSLENLVCELAELKMAHIVYPPADEGRQAFFLTADTMTLAASGSFFGKPATRKEAIAMLTAVRAGARIGTGFCVERRRYLGGIWKKEDRTVGYAEGFCVVDIPDEGMAYYLERVPFTEVSGGITIEGFGEQFVREVRGSYSAILGLPMYAVREALSAMGFFGIK